MIKYLLALSLLGICSSAFGELVGGRLNAFSEGNNAFAGIINPANAVWVPDRLDVGAFWVHKKSSITNDDNNPVFPPGKIDIRYKTRNFYTADVAINKRVTWQIGCQCFDGAISLAYFTIPPYEKLRTKAPVPILGNTPVFIKNRVDDLSLVFSFKLNTSHSIGFSLDYLHFSHRRDGFQKSDNAARSVSPGNVTNNGLDHSSGVGFSLGWRWKMTEKLNFGMAWTRKSHCGQFRKYRGYEPHHAENFIPQTIGGGFTYHFNSKLAALAEVLWINLGNVPDANNNVLPNGQLNLNKRGSNKSPGPGFNDATFFNIGFGYKLYTWLALGAGYSHRIKFRGKNFLSHTYRLITIYDILSVGANFNYQRHNLFLGFSYGFPHRSSGLMPTVLGGGRFSAKTQETSLSLSWGYLY